jgi:hypothetical protein
MKEFQRPDRGENRTSQFVESIEALHMLKQTRDEYIAICRIQFKNASDPSALLTHSDSITELQVLSHEKDGSATVYLRGKPMSWLVEDLAPLVGSSGIHMYGLFELKAEKLKAAYIGNVVQVRRFLRELDRSHIKYRIISLGDARFSADSPLYALTEKQRRILISAFGLGYYKIPRRISFVKLAQHLNLGSSTVNEHLRKAESRLISELLLDRND